MLNRRVQCSLSLLIEEGKNEFHRFLLLFIIEVCSLLRRRGTSIEFLFVDSNRMAANRNEKAHV